MMNETNQTCAGESCTPAFNGTLFGASFTTASTISGLVMLVILLCSVSLSPAVLWALWKTKQLRCPVYRLVAFLLVDEILVRVFGSPLIMTSMIAGRWLYGYLGCVFYGFMMTWLGVTASSLFTCIAVERCIIVCYSGAKSYLTPRIASLVALFCYLNGLCWAALPLVGVDQYVFEPSGLSCTPNWSPNNKGYIFGLFTMCCAFPVIMSTLCYTKIYKTVVKSNSISNNVTVEGAVAKVMILTMAAFLFSWTPYSVFGILTVLGYSDKIQMAKEVTLIPLVTAKTAGMWHPLIFSFKNKRIRHLFAKQYEKLKIVFHCNKSNQILPKTEHTSTNLSIGSRQKRNTAICRTGNEALCCTNSEQIENGQLSNEYRKLTPRAATMLDSPDQTHVIFTVEKSSEVSKSFLKMQDITDTWQTRDSAF